MAQYRSSMNLPYSPAEQSLTLGNPQHFNVNKLDCGGSAAFGSYAGVAAPADGLVVSGVVGIGTSSPGCNAQLVIAPELTLSSTISTGVSVQPTFTQSIDATNLYGEQIAPAFNPSSTNTFTDTYGLQIAPTAIPGSGTVTNATTLLLTTPTGATNNYAAEITGVGSIGVGAAPTVEKYLNIAPSLTHTETIIGVAQAVTFGLTASTTTAIPTVKGASYTPCFSPTNSTTGQTTSITSAYGVYIQPEASPGIGGCIENMYSLYVKTPTVDKSLNSYTAILGDASTALVGVGTSTPRYMLDIAGNCAVSAVGSGFRVKEGADAKMGISKLVTGMVTVFTKAVTVNSRIFLTIQAPGEAVGTVYISATTPGTSFTITSTSAIDTSTIAWLIFEPA